LRIDRNYRGIDQDKRTLTIATVPQLMLRQNSSLDRRIRTTLCITAEIRLTLIDRRENLDHRHQCVTRHLAHFDPRCAHLDARQHERPSESWRRDARPYSRFG